MSDTDGPAGQELCVLYREAIYWIVFRNFRGRAVGVVGPRPLEKLPRFGYDDDDEAVEYGIDIGRLILAQDLLLDYAAKGRIRVYANEGSTANEASLSFPIQLTAEFLAKAEFDFDECEGPTLFIREEQSFYELAVHYGDLLRGFWGNAPPITIPDTIACPAPDEQAEPPHAADLRARQTDAAARAMTRRGRRPKYAWADFSAELLRRVISGPPMANQAALERHMQEWCVEKWHAEPAVSQIRDWVGPAYRMISRSSAADRTAKETADNSSPKFAKAADG